MVRDKKQIEGCCTEEMSFWWLLGSISDREATSVIIALVLWVNKIFVLWPAVFGTLNIGSICEEKKNEILRKVKLYNDVVFSH